MSLIARLEALDKIAEAMPGELGLVGLQKCFEGSLIYSMFQIKDPRCKVFASAETPEVIEWIDCTLSKRLNRLCEKYGAYWLQQDEKIEGRFTRTYTILSYV